MNIHPDCGLPSEECDCADFYLADTLQWLKSAAVKSCLTCFQPVLPTFGCPCDQVEAMLLGNRATPLCTPADPNDVPF